MASYLLCTPAYAADTKINVEVISTGGNVGPLNIIGDDLCPTASTNGCDFSADDEIIRTHDGIMYEFAMQVDPPGDRVVLEAVLKPGMVWDELHGLCNFTTSTITGDGSVAAPSKISCDLGVRSAWATNLHLMARVLGDNPNGTVVGIETAQLIGDVSPLAVGDVSHISDSTVTAKPRLNVRLRNYGNGATTRNGVAGAYAQYMVFLELWDHDRNGDPADDPDTLLGNELITGPVTVDLDLSGVSPGAELYWCGPSSTGHFPYDTYNSTYPERSVGDAGTRSCTYGTGALTFTFTDTDFSFNQVPTETRTGSAIPGNRSYASTMFYTIFVPLADVNAAGGELQVDTELTDLNATSISGQENLAEDTSDNRTGTLLKSGPGSFSHTLRCYMSGTTRPSWCGDLWYNGPTDASSVSTGDGSIQPDQTFVSYTYYRNRSFTPDSFADLCAVFDTRYYNVTEIDGQTVRLHGTYGTEGVDYVYEYGNGYVSTAWQDAATVPANAVPDECNAPAANWNTNIAAAKAVGPITKIRARRLKPLPAGASFAMVTNLKARSSADLAAVPLGTLFKTWGTFRAETTIADYRSCDYISGVYPTPTHSTDSCGERLYFNRAVARIGKITIPDNRVNVVSAGGSVTYELSPSFTTVNGSGSDDILIIDKLPVSTTYVTDSATQNGTPFPPTITGTPETGQTLTWDLGTRNANVPIIPIQYTLNTSLKSRNGTVLENKVEIRPAQDIAPVENRTASRRVTMSVPVSLLLGKTVDRAKVNRDDPLAFTVEYFNSTPQSIDYATVIDILPYQGDGRIPATNFSGTFKLVGVTAQSPNGEFYFSKDAPSSIKSDPSDASNNLSTGSTNWCPATAGNEVNPTATPAAGGSAAACPTDFSEVTAIRFDDGEPLPVSTSRTIGIKAETEENFGGDIYTNQAQANAQGVSLSPRSPFATSSVIEKLDLAIEKSEPVHKDEDGSGDITDGDILTYTITATNNSNRPLTNVVVSDAKTDPASVTCATVAIGGTCVLTGDYTVSLDDAAAGEAKNIATANSDQTTDPTESKEVVTNVAQKPSIAIVKSAPANADDDGSGDISVNDVLTYTITATNDGNIPLTNVEVKDNKITPASKVCATVAVDATCVLTGTYTVTQADADSGDITNTASVTTAEITDPQTTPEVVTTFPQKPSMKITKSQPNNADNDGSGDISLNDVLTYTIVATNDGNVTLNNVELSDPKTTPSSKVCATVPIGSSCVLTGTYTVTQVDVDAGSVKNTASGTSDEITDPTTTPEVDTTTAQNPSMKIVKTAPSNADNDGSGDVSLGDVLTYTITATNNGDVTLTNVVVSDAKTTPASKTCASVAIGGTCVLTGSYTVVQSDVDAGSVKNSASVTSNETTGSETTPEVETTSAQNPSVKLVKSDPVNADNDGSGNLSKDDVLTYTVTATNDGDTTLTNVVVSDAKITPSSITCPSVAIGDTCVLSGTYTVTQADVVSGNVSNSASVTTGEVPEVTTRPVVTTVASIEITAEADITPSVNSASGGSDIGNAFDNDTLGGQAVDPSEITGTIVTPAVPLTPDAPVPAVDPATGVISVPPGTPAGSYEITYQICENLNPGNCVTATVTVPVDVTPLHAVGNNLPAVNGLEGNPNAGNAFGNDTLNGAPLNVSDITATITAPATPATPGAPVPTMDPATGIISVPPGTPAGTYEISYQICETINPSNCTNATSTVVVEAAQLEVGETTPTPVNGSDGTPDAGNVIDNVTLNGTPVDPSDITVTVTIPATPATPGAPVPAIDPVTGVISVPPSTPAGTYEITYEVCENLNPDNCVTSTVSVTVDAPELVINPDTIPAVNGSDGTPDAGNIYDNDTLNGEPVDPSLLTTTITSPATPATPGAPVPAIDPVTGVVSVPPGTPAGTYEITYEVCENLNPDNCVTSTVSVTVDAPELVINPDTIPAVNGSDGTPDAGNIYDNDTLNGTPVDPSLLTTTITSPATPATPGAPVPAIDPVTGVISVPPSTPAGTYEITYEVCETLNPDNCVTSTVSVTVDAPELVINPDTIPAVNGSDGTPDAGNIYDNDTLNGTPVDPNLLTTTITSPATPATPGAPVPALDPVTGVISVPPSTPAGTYEITYEVCETLNPDNCVTSTIAIVVDPAVIDAPDGASYGPIDSTEGDPNVGSIYDGVTLNGETVDPNDMIASIVTPAVPAEDGALVPVIDLTTGIISVPPGTPAGDYEITYQICEALNPDNCTTTTVSVTVSPPVAGLSGIVFVDENGDGIYQEGEELLRNWIIEITGEDGHIVTTVRTDENGYYIVEGLPLGECIISFRNPHNNVLYGTISEVNLENGNIVVDQNLPIDPSGVVYNSVTRNPVEGTVLTIVGADGTPLPEICLLDPTQQNQATDASGMYRFDIIPGNAAACPVGESDYRIIFDAPGDYSDNPSSVIAPQVDALNPPAGIGSFAVAPQAHAPSAGEATTYYVTFVLGSGDRDIINNHIALDPFQNRSPLLVRKTSTKRTASVGDLIPYAITVQNNDNVQRSGVDVIDIVPAGLKYVEGSARINGTASEPLQSGRELRWENQTIDAGSSSTYEITLVVGAGVTGGDRANIGLARNGFDDEEISNRGQAIISIVASAVFDCSEIIGKVFNDANGDGYQDKGELGIAGVRLATVNGELITTDEHGRYHITCAAVPDARIGSNYVLKLDPRTLPAGYSVTSENPRSVRLTRGKITKLNFGAKQADAVTVSLNSSAFMAGGNRLKPEFAAQLGGIRQAIDPKSPHVRIVYQASQAEDLKAARERVTGLKQAIAALFATDWDGPAPSIETEVTRTGTNPNANPNVGGE